MYKKLISVLNARGISRYKLSKMTGIHHPNLYNALNGKTPLYGVWRAKISEALQIPESELFDD